MKCCLVGFRSRGSMSATTFRLPLACLAMVLTVLSTCSMIVTAGAEGFVVLPDSSPRLSGSVGREADVFEILATRERTGGVIGLFRVTVAPKSGPGVHIHRGEDEFFYVLKGEFHFKHGDHIVSAPAGSLVFLPRGHAAPFKILARSPASCWGA